MEPELEGSDGNEGAAQQEPVSFGTEFLNNVADEDKPYVEKYIKDWDSNVTKKFDEIHGQYKGYKDLGDIDSLKESMQVAHILETDPKLVYDILAAELGVGNQQQQQNQNGAGGNDQLPSNLPEHFEGLTPKQVEYFSNLEKMLNDTAQIVIKSREVDQQRSEDQKLESELGRLKGEWEKKGFGEFDEEYILSKMYHGKSGDQALADYEKLVQNVTNGQAQQKRPQPPSLAGGGPLPANQVDVTKLDRKSTRNLVADMLQKAAQQD